ncbi:acyl-CoA thioesterase [Bacillus kwashiorkori]|uniref:acyl-CoA thioesterase n=1 Tax=Bacillus kwashiorkori TaxID=1522318 RepID=UPI000783EC05|nr:thioesterase family protein [Bacillus kwashiorkori]
MKKIPYIADFDKWLQEFEFYYPIKVRFSETDMFGHVNNTVPFVYFEMARIEYFKSLGFMQDWSHPKSETIPVVADLQCDFLAQMFFDEEIRVYVKANRIGTSSVDLHYLGKKRDGSICFTGRGTMVHFNRKLGKAEAWTQEMLKSFERVKNIMENSISK